MDETTLKLKDKVQTAAMCRGCNDLISCILLRRKKRRITKTMSTTFATPHISRNTIQPRQPDNLICIIVPQHQYPLRF